MTDPTNLPPSMQPIRNSTMGNSARSANFVLGIWLFISGFIWPHTPASQTNTCIVGLLIVAVAAIASTMPQARWCNTILAVWLFISTFAIRHVSTSTVWNNLIVAVLVFLLSLVPNRSAVG
jgi:hypothetical protein